MRLFDVESELIIVGFFGECIGGAERAHEAIELWGFEQGESADEGFVESEVDVFLFFF